MLECEYGFPFPVPSGEAAKEYSPRRKTVGIDPRKIRKPRRRKRNPGKDTLETVFASKPVA